jgi:glycopeptide antibiotics resistance protein
LALVTLCVYGAFVAAATLSPTPLDQGYQSSINRLLAVLHRNGVPEWFGYSKLEFTANIGMFIPLGLLVAMLFPARLWWLALLICPAFSVAIELTQSVALSSRFATASDVIANSSGALIGITCAVILHAVIYERDKRLIARTLWEHGHRS